MIDGEPTTNKEEKKEIQKEDTLLVSRLFKQAKNLARIFGHAIEN